MAELLIKIF